MEDILREYKMKMATFNKTIKEFAKKYNWTVNTSDEIVPPALEPKTDIVFHAPGDKEDFYCKYRITTEFYNEHLREFFLNLKPKG